jgi:hypothetical protein
VALHTTAAAQLTEYKKNLCVSSSSEYTCSSDLPLMTMPYFFVSPRTRLSIIFLHHEEKRLSGFTRNVEASRTGKRENHCQSLKWHSNDHEDTRLSRDSRITLTMQDPAKQTDLVSSFVARSTMSMCISLKSKRRHVFAISHAVSSLSPERNVVIWRGLYSILHDLSELLSLHIV